MFAVTGLGKFKATLEAAKAKQIGAINRSYREFVRKVLIELATNTPQWSGDLAASWRVRVEGVTTRETADTLTGFKSKPVERPAPHFRGDLDPVHFALLNNEEVISTIRYNSTVTIFNDNATAEKIDNPWMEELWLRPGNFIAGDIMAIAHTIAKFSHGNLILRRG